MNVSVIVPWQPGDAHREAAWEHLRPRWEPFGEVIEGVCDGQWVKATAVADGLTRASGDMLIIADADVWVDPSEALAACETWAVPHLKVHRLSEESTRRVIAGEDWQGLPLDRNGSAQDMKPYKGIAGGGVTVIRRDMYDKIPLDRRFVGWGREDNAWGAALHCIAGPPWRGDANLVHLWHPPQDRPNRIKGAAASERLWSRYRQARRNPEQMRVLVEESK